MFNYFNEASNTEEERKFKERVEEAKELSYISEIQKRINIEEDLTDHPNPAEERE